MIKHLKATDYKITPWKNGLGITKQIAIHPPEANFSEGLFDWRISCAEVGANGPFSEFPGFERLLVVWKGNGVKLNSKSLLPFVVHSFSGTEKINCELINGPVTDLGIIYSPKKVKVTLEVINGSCIFSLKNGTHFIFCAYQSAQINHNQIKENECLIIENEKNKGFEISTAGIALLISLD